MLCRGSGHANPEGERLFLSDGVQLASGYYHYNLASLAQQTRDKPDEHYATLFSNYLFLLDPLTL